jgi:serine/threonine protein kinase
MQDDFSAALVGQRIGPYILQEVLGRGGMGAVFLGEHEIIKSRVAVKVLDPRYTNNNTVVRRFFSEARAANLIGHENIVKIFDLSTTPDGLRYLVMEYLDGATLEEYISGSALRLEAIAPIVMQVADALAAAHEHGVIHRDLKPANIMLVPVADRLIAKVLDFGIAKLLEGQSVVQSAPENIFGTPHYMAPEHATGSKLDARADVYSLGVILYRIATGQLPFDGGSASSIMLAHIQLPPPPPRLMNPEIAEPYEAIILKALAKSPEERYQSILDLKSALIDAIRSSPIPAANTDLLPKDLDAFRKQRTFDLVKLSRSVPVRRSERKEASFEVQVRVADAAHFQRMYTRDVSNTGMFIATDGEMPPLLSTVDLVLLAPSFGRITLTGKVVRHVSLADAEARKSRAGFGVELTDFDAAKRQQIESLLSGLPRGRDTSTPDTSTRVQDIIARLTMRPSLDHYQMLGIDPWAEVSQIREATARLLNETQPEQMRDAPKVMLARLEQTRQRIRAVADELLAPIKRAAYDAERGNYEGVARALKAGLSQKELDTLREKYLEEHPGAARAARAAASEAKLAVHAERIDMACKALELALKIDPLNLELHNEYWPIRSRATTRPMPS